MQCIKSWVVSDVDASCLARIVCSVSLQVIRDLMSTSKASAVASDVLTCDFVNLYLDMRVRFIDNNIDD